jgi:glycosyltransferase involved in cell wall biosynthesis
MIPGKTGLVVPCETPEPLAQAVVQLLQNDALRMQMGADARRWAAEHFDWEKLADSARELFRCSQASFHPAGIVAENSAAETSVSALR